jgi:AIPR protein
MSIIHVGHIKNAVSRFGNLLDLSDVQNASSEQEESCRLTRSLAAFVVAELGGLDDVAAAQAVTDGTGDNGIDAVYYGPVEKNCLLVQSKWIASGNGSVEVGDVHKFIQGVRDLLDANFSRFNAKMQAHQGKVFAALSDASARFTLVLAYTGEQLLSVEARLPLDDFLAEMNSPTDVMTLRVLNQEALHSIVARGATADAVDLEVMLHDWGMVREPYLAYYGQVAVSDIVSWSAFGARLTSKNLRQFRGLTEVNESIAKTLHASPENFWYFNNGITVLCESLRKKPLGGNNNETGTFECKGASVVNGAQTVGTIVDVSKTNGASLQNSRVLVRLVSLENCPEGFADEITRAANTQNRIERRDFAALDPNQKRLRTELYLENQKEYAYQTGEQPPQGDSGCTLDEAAVALACRVADVSLAVQAKREVGMLYEDITKTPYTAIFNRQTTARVLWEAVTVLRNVESELSAEQQNRAGKEQLIAIHGNRFVLHLVFQQLQAAAVNNTATQEFATRTRELTRDMLAGTIRNVLDHYPTAYPAMLFKNATKCRDLARRILTSGRI